MAAIPQTDVDLLLELLEGATDRLVATMATLGEEEAAGPSALPGWTRAHLLTHLARNAEDHRRMAEAAAAGEVAEQCPGGDDQREEEIRDGARTPAAVLVEEVTRSAADLRAAWDAMPEDAWDRPIAMLDGTMPARVGPRSRLTECELHHVDLRLGYRPTDWPPEVGAVLLPRVADELVDRAGRLDPPLPRVVVRPTDGDGEWVIGTAGGGATVTGPAAALVAWMAGRGWALADGDLAVDGDRAVVDALPERLPYG